MARQKGSANLAATIEVLAGGALDARTVVPTEADLVLASNFPYPYVGMFTVVKATGEMWILTDEDVTDIEHWHKVGSGGADNVIEGYYNETDGKFYEDDQYTTEIEGVANTLYIALDTNLLYRFDGTDFVAVTEETPQTVTLTQAEFDALPQSEKDNGTIYYITDSSAVQGISVMGNRFDKANIYTENERMIGSYMGKPLYQKTIGVTVSAEYSLVSGVFMRGSYSLLDAGLDIEDMPFVDGFYTDGNNTLSFIDTWYDKADSNLYFITYLDRENVAAEITMQYTKVYDGTVAIGTGTDYSTDEQIIGTWIDGKPLYQKTFTGIVPTFTPPSDSVLDPATLNIAMDCLVDVFVSVSGFIQTVAGNYVPFPFTETAKNVTYKESSSATTLDSYPQTTTVFGRPNASTSMPNNIRVVNMNQNFNNRPLCVTAQYTKTTD